MLSGSGAPRFKTPLGAASHPLSQSAACRLGRHSIVTAQPRCAVPAGIPGLEISPLHHSAGRPSGRGGDRGGLPNGFGQSPAHHPAEKVVS